MSTTTVSRRVIFTKMKKTRKPRVPLPRRPSPSDEMVGEQAKPFVFLGGTVPRAVPASPWWQKALRPAAIALGVLVCGACAYFLANQSSRPSYDRGAETRASAASSTSGGARPSRVRIAQSSAYPGGDSVVEPIVLSNRAAPTDASFRATAYVRKKVSLPNISGNCVVSDSGSRDIGECLRRQLEP